MKKKRTKKKISTKIYIEAAPERNEVIYSGIEFCEFIKYLPRPIENLMIITGGCDVISLETRFERGLELFEGYDLVKKLSKENVHGFGDFCFVDYASSQKTNDLSEEQIAELLYLGHMFKPLHSPFLEPLDNNFAYLAHDDGWYCKLYCRNITDFITVLCKKITAGAPIKNICEPLIDIKESLLKLAKDGLLIDLNESLYKSGCIEVKLYVVGSYSDMDRILNNFEQIKNRAIQTYNLHCSEKEWSIT